MFRILLAVYLANRAACVARRNQIFIVLPRAGIASNSAYLHDTDEAEFGTKRMHNSNCLQGQSSISACQKTPSMASPKLLFCTSAAS